VTVQTVTGTGETGDVRIGLVVAQYNDFVTNRLRDGAMGALRAAGVGGEAVVVAPVPGAFEVPQAARRLASAGGVDAVIGLGCLIRGETPHFEVIAAAVAHGLTQAALDSGTPMTFGVLTTNSAEEALARAGAGPSNKGWEAADAALVMVRLFRQLGQPGTGGGRPA
jgi:6,7-dimethyl-8-ribityllumazine synthase